MKKHTPRMSGDERRDQIARAALALAENGLREVTIGAVAKAVGLVPSAIYRHFENREAMLRGAFALLRGKLLANIQISITDPDPMAGLEGFWRRHLSVMREHRATPRIIFSEDIAAEHSPFREMLVRAQDVMVQGMVGIIARGQEQGSIRTELPADDLAIIFLGQVLLPAHMYFIRLGEFDIEGQMSRNWKCVKAMIVPDGRSA